MGDEKSHLTQAEHNKTLANVLARRRPFHDWGITVGFYAAMHFFECFLAKKMTNAREQHSETSWDQQKTNSIHQWREELVRTLSTQRAWRIYRKLRTQSELARYFTSGYQNIEQPYFQYHDPEQVQGLLIELDDFRKEIKV